MKHSDLHASRAVAGHYKRPESVLVVVCTADGEVLLLQRRQPADYWQSVTGSLEDDETPLQAAQRELHEETGLTIPVRDCRHSNTFTIHPAWRARYAPGVERNREHVFLACCGRRPDIRLNPKEHRACRWMRKAEAARCASSRTNRDAILAYVP